MDRLSDTHLTQICTPLFLFPTKLYPDIPRVSIVLHSSPSKHDISVMLREQVPGSWPIQHLPAIIINTQDYRNISAKWGGPAGWVKCNSLRDRIATQMSHTFASEHFSLLSNFLWNGIFAIAGRVNCTWGKSPPRFSPPNASLWQLHKQRMPGKHTYTHTHTQTPRKEGWQAEKGNPWPGWSFIQLEVVFFCAYLVHGSTWAGKRWIRNVNPFYNFLQYFALR